MNERIKELYQKARGIRVMSDQFMENWEYEFAALLVKECADVGAANGDSEVSGIIKHHFGLE